MTDRFIFLHIIKCGGTSMRYMLLDEFGYDRIAPVPVGQSTDAQRYPTTKDNPLIYQATVTPKMVQGYSVVMSHYDWRITERLPDWHIITLFRNPVKQLYSTFRFMKRNHDLRRMHFDMQDMTFRQWLLSDSGKRATNAQTRFMSAHGNENLDVALSNLRNERLTFGIMERYEESIDLFNQKFGWSLTLRHDNAAPSPADFDVETYNLAMNLQADDMILYQAAKELFEERIEA